MVRRGANDAIKKWNAALWSLFQLHSASSPCSVLTASRESIGGLILFPSTCDRKRFEIFIHVFLCCTFGLPSWRDHRDKISPGERDGSRFTQSRSQKRGRLVESQGFSPPGRRGIIGVPQRVGTMVPSRSSTQETQDSGQAIRSLRGSWIPGSEPLRPSQRLKAQHRSRRTTDQARPLRALDPADAEWAPALRKLTSDRLRLLSLFYLFIFVYLLLPASQLEGLGRLELKYET